MILPLSDMHLNRTPEVGLLIIYRVMSSVLYRTHAIIPKNQKRTKNKRDFHRLRKPLFV